ncbi:class I SAM-dependent methyltransferase [Xylophilus sp.]|uniref:class I SAM-dependent methyltransferase n=1 Tax=Xylophilus sp. TaxID=2653893 RepID=UPI0013B8D76C|nr:class I SAM-dependent methyltransferase [Xylophilus sp.]KAF1048105.1 MAG: hypothetical protein GAK38_01576 [Xylophilus sp.]
MSGIDPSVFYGADAASRYDDTKRGDEADASALLAGVAAGRPALELAIGPGRIALPLSEHGVEVRGIELSTHMIDRLRSKPGGETIPVTWAKRPLWGQKQRQIPRRSPPAAPSRNNAGMQPLRNARLLARLALVWFVLYLGSAAASPLLAAQTFELVCTSVGMVKVVIKSDNGEPVVHKAAMDCPLCAPGGAPPPPAVVLNAVPAQPLAYATWPVPAARIAALTAAPLPARGPPSFS